MMLHTVKHKTMQFKIMKVINLWWMENSATYATEMGARRPAYNDFKECYLCNRNGSMQASL